jgi:hypothetical protein
VLKSYHRKECRNKYHPFTELLVLQPKAAITPPITVTINAGVVKVHWSVALQYQAIELLIASA